MVLIGVVDVVIFVVVVLVDVEVNVFVVVDALLEVVVVVDAFVEHEHEVGTTVVNTISNPSARQ
jgi:hypothetical protein